MEDQCDEPIGERRRAASAGLGWRGRPRMKQSRLQVYDPPMCCSSGVCGPAVNPELARFSSDLDWLRRQGVEVERHNLSSRPGAFVQQRAVMESLKNEGNDCLPLIVVNGLIVSKGIYPTRSDLMKLSGIGSEQEIVDATPAAADAVGCGNATAVCGPGCNCGTSSSSRRMKSVVTLIAGLAVVSIFAFKASRNPWDAVAATNGSAFAIAPASSAAVSEAGARSSSVTEKKEAAETALPEDKLMTENAPAAAKTGQKIGEYLESLSTLNEVALNQDAVFIFIPAQKSETADGQTSTAVLAAQQTLKRNNITLGLYTLPVNSSDYSGISAQVQTPAVLVASKGRGMAAVSGEVTETKLLQAYMTSSSVGGCGPSGCGPSGCGPIGCK